MSLQISKLAKHYYEGNYTRTLFSSLDLTINEGATVALVGRSGSGKSTLLNLISGIDLPDAGQIWVKDQEITALRETERTLWRRRQLGFVFQFFNLIPTLSIVENVLLPLELNSLNTQREKENALTLLDQVGLSDRANDFPENLSGGEQQRIAVVRALVHKPTLLLADEPTGNLDAYTGAEVFTLMIDLAKEINTTVLVATHSDAVLSEVNRVIHLENGFLRESAIE